MQERMPSVFISHGSPMVAVESGSYQQALATFGESVRPRAIVIVSAHWAEQETVLVSQDTEYSLIYDFGGFPRELYQLTYPAKGIPELALKIVARLRASEFAAETVISRGLDHGAWVPLRLIYPKADIPIVQISLPATMSPSRLVELGKCIAPLRDTGVMVLGSGGVVHNLRRFNPYTRDGEVYDWASEFDHWFRTALLDWDTKLLLSYAEKAPNAHLAVPTPEHFVPVFVVIGAVGETTTGRVKHIYEGMEYGSISLRSFQVQ